jgi:cell division protein FtsB
MAKSDHSASSEIAETSTELENLRREERYVTDAFRKVEITPDIKWLALKIRRILDLEKDVENLLKRVIPLEEQQARYETMAYNPKYSAKARGEIQKLTNKIRTVNREIETLNKEIYDLERQILTKINKNEYGAYRDILAASTLTAEDFARLQHLAS